MSRASSWKGCAARPGDPTNLTPCTPGSGKSASSATDVYPRRVVATFCDSLGRCRPLARVLIGELTPNRSIAAGWRGGFRVAGALLYAIAPVAEDQVAPETVHQWLPLRRGIGRRCEHTHSKLISLGQQIGKVFVRLHLRELASDHHKFDACRGDASSVSFLQLRWACSSLLGGVLVVASKVPPAWLRRRLRGAGPELAVVFAPVLPSLPTALQMSAAMTDSAGSLLIQILVSFAKAGTLAFGSGLATIPFLEQGVVRDYGWLSEQQFL